MGKFLTELKTRFGQKLEQINESKAVKKAMAVYNSIGRQLQGQRANANQVMNDEPSRLRNVLLPEHVGKLAMFFYDPKMKEELPYYDRNPLIMLLSVDSEGFTAINFHYLYPLLRANLLDMIMADTEYKFLKNPEEARYNRFARRQLNMSYRKLQGLCASGLYKPCVKRYLWKHVRSRFYLIDPDDWATLLPLPLERFEKKTAQRVWEDSFNKVFKS